MQKAREFRQGNGSTMAITPERMAAIDLEAEQDARNSHCFKSAIEAQLRNPFVRILIADAHKEGMDLAAAYCDAMYKDTGSPHWYSAAAGIRKLMVAGDG